jgi:peptide/nickel transport system permease protein
MVTADLGQTPLAPASTPDRIRRGGRRLGPVEIGCIVYLAALLLGAVLSLLLPQIDPLTADFASPLRPPSTDHWFGTDSNGRDVFHRTIAGAWSSITVAALTLLIGGGIGSLLGVLAGYVGGVIDAVISMIIEFLLSLPGLILVMVVVTLVGPSYAVIGCLVGVLLIAPFARIARASAISLRDRPFVHAARLLGAGAFRIAVFEIARNVLPSIGAYSFIAITAAIAAEGALSFLGFGLQPPTPSWGNLIAEGRTHLAIAPWITMAPALVLCATILALNIIGERLASKTESLR